MLNDTATTEIYTYVHTLSLHDALPIYGYMRRFERTGGWKAGLMRLPDIEHCIAALREHAGAAGRRGQRAGRARPAVAAFHIAKNPGKFRCGVVIARQRAAYRTRARVQDEIGRAHV